jgi:alcohol dehydrogenase class IV
MDAAKCIGIMVANTRDILEFRGVDLVENPLPPMVFVPSTAGTASEVSQFSIVLDTRERVKIAIVSNRVVPDVALVDPAHSLGGFLDMPHGECNAILLPHVVDFNYDAEPERYDRIGLRLGVSADTPAADRKAALLAAIRNMQRVVGMDHGLAAVGVKHDDIPALARKAREDPCLLTNPKACTEEDLEGIFRAAMFV